MGGDNPETCITPLEQTLQSVSSILCRFSDLGVFLKLIVFILNSLEIGSLKRDAAI